MAVRSFASARVPRGDFGPRLSAAEIRCQRCGATDHVFNARMTGKLPPEVLAKKFGRAGWAVGTTAAADLCPACVARSSLPKLVKLPIQRGEAMTKPTPIAPEAADAVRPATPSAAAVMARRRVNQRLFEVYDGEGGGYTRGWTDKRVAEALGVSVGLVAEVREQFHGSLSDSFEARELLARAELIFAEAASIETRASGLSGEIRQLIDTVTLLRADAEAIRRAFS